METTMTMLRFGLAALGLIVAFLVTLFAPGAWAHAMLDHASPAVGSTVSAAPHEVRLWFTQPLEPQFSAAQLRSSAGGVVGTGHVDPADPKTLVIPVRALPAGRYKVEWKVLSVDTHRTEGNFGFEVRP
jgi:methionine-rich copper-binding protein CopC